MRALILITLAVTLLPVAVLGLIAMWMVRKGFAPGWQARCSQCGTVIPAGKIPGVIRIHTHHDFKSVANHRCDTCGETRSFDIEYSPKE